MSRTTDGLGIVNSFLIRCAILHYQFETLHPFLDGNGRMGRLMIPLYLLDKKVISKPCFYISDYFERRRIEYYDSLQRARINNDLSGWIRFFLDAARDTAENAIRKFERVVDLVDRYNQRIINFQVKNTENFRKVIFSFVMCGK